MSKITYHRAIMADPIDRVHARGEKRSAAAPDADEGVVGMLKKLDARMGKIENRLEALEGGGRAPKDSPKESPEEVAARMVSTARSTVQERRRMDAAFGLNVARPISASRSALVLPAVVARRGAA